MNVYDATTRQVLGGGTIEIDFQLPFCERQVVRFQQMSRLDIEGGMPRLLPLPSILETVQKDYRCSHFGFSFFGKSNVLILKGGVFSGAGLLTWLKNGLERLVLTPINILLIRGKQVGLPFMQLELVNVLPRFWSVSAFDIETKQIFVEEIVFSFEHVCSLKDVDDRRFPI